MPVLAKSHYLDARDQRLAPFARFQTSRWTRHNVVIRFKLGSLRYLVVIEVKNRTRKTAAADIDGFAQKARDQNASKAVFVTASGFQDGAIKVAKRHGVDLFTVAFDEQELHYPPNGTNLFIHDGRASFVPKVEPSITVGERHVVNNATHATLRYTDGREHDLPDEATQMTYYCEQTRLSDGRSLAELIQNAPIPNAPAGETLQVPIMLAPPRTMTPPDDYFFPAGEVMSVELTVMARHGRALSGNTKVEPTTFSAPVVYTNVLTGESSRFGLSELPLGGRRVSVGSFYFLYHPLRYYFCDAIKGQQVRWDLIESFQNGVLLTATMMQDVKHSCFYIPVADKKIINRLQRRLDDYRKLRKRDHLEQRP